MTLSLPVVDPVNDVWGATLNAAATALDARLLRTGYTPYDFGGVGDGVTVDTAALQAAIDTKNCYLPPDVTWVQDAALRIPTGARILGGGPTSVIKAKSDAVDTVGYISLLNADTTAGNSQITLDGFTVDANYQGRNAAVAASAVRFLAADANACEDIVLRGVTIRNAPFAALQLMNCRHVQVLGCRVDDTKRDGITVYFNCRHVTIAGNVITEVRDDGIALNSEGTGHVGTQIKHVTITGNTIAHATDSVNGNGVNVAGAEDVTVSANVVEYAHGWGIIAQGGYISGASLPSVRVAITANTVRESGTSLSSAGGVSVSNTTGATVTGNAVDNYWTNGINLASAATCNANYVALGKTNTSIGVFVSAQGCTVSGNRFYHCGSSGVSTTAEKTAISANTFEDCCVIATTGSYLLLAANLNRCVVTGNVLRKTASGTGSFGVRLATGTGDRNIVTSNMAQGFTAGNGVSSGASGVNNQIANNNDG